MEKLLSAIEKVCLVGLGWDDVNSSKVVRVHTVQPPLSPRTFGEAVRVTSNQLLEEKRKADEDVRRRREVMEQRKHLEPMELD